MTLIEMKNQVPRVVAINISEKKGIPKKTIAKGRFIEKFGLEGDVHGGDWHRQVSFLARESIDKMRAQGVQELTSGSFAENITTENIDLTNLKVGDQLQIGEVVFEITQIGKECHQKCAIFNQVGNCVMPREGIFARVLRSGEVCVGDEIKIL